MTYKLPFYSFLFKYLIICGVILLSFSAGQAQTQSTKDNSGDSTAAAVLWPADSLGRSTPRGTVEGFLRAVATENYRTAALYLALDPKLKKQQDSLKLVLALKNLIENTGKIYPYSRISNETTGAQDDDLGTDLDLVGHATVNDQTFDLILEQKKDTSGAPIWLFSSQTVQIAPLDTAVVEKNTLVEDAFPTSLNEKKWAGVPVSHWVAIIILIAAAYFVAVLITHLVVYVIPLVWRRARKESTAGIIASFVQPIRLYLAVWLFVAGSRAAGVSILIRQRLNDLTLIVGMVAILLLLWQLVNFIARLTEKRMRLKGNYSGISAVLFMRRAAKVALVILGILVILDTFGFNVTTWLTALGIGGIALALGTQKTVENLVGSVTIIADHPIRVGDYCKAGDVSGTVEQIGMRTTQIRTGERTIVSIPNGEFASMKIENFAPRDKFLFHRTFGLRCDTTSAQIRYLLKALLEMLSAHPKMEAKPRVRFITITADSLDLEIFCYLRTTDNDEFLEIQETLLLNIMDVVEASGTAFSLPSQTVYFPKNQELTIEKKSSEDEID